MADFRIVAKASAIRNHEHAEKYCASFLKTRCRNMALRQRF
jgi:hypothetical protein